jgi:hypothetical protein
MELEILHGVLRNPALANHAFFYFRNPNFGLSLPEQERKDFAVENAASAKKLRRLKEEVRKSGLACGRIILSPRRWVN